jgi:hypothetical protein
LNGKPDDRFGGEIFIGKEKQRVGKRSRFSSRKRPDDRGRLGISKGSDIELFMYLSSSIDLSSTF